MQTTIRHQHIRNLPFWLKSFLVWELFTRPFMLISLRLMLLNPQIRARVLPQLDSLWQTPLYDAFGIAEFICALAIWRWKRWGVFGLLSLEFGQWFIGLFTAQLAHRFWSIVVFLPIMLVLVALFSGLSGMILINTT